jgi:hypothetical protein
MQRILPQWRKFLPDHELKKAAFVRGFETTHYHCVNEHDVGVVDRDEDALCGRWHDHGHVSDGSNRDVRTQLLHDAWVNEHDFKAVNWDEDYWYGCYSCVWDGSTGDIKKRFHDASGNMTI